eukprot:109478-Prymnesium_polylepis.1
MERNGSLRERKRARGRLVRWHRSGRGVGERVKLRVVVAQVVLGVVVQQRKKAGYTNGREEDVHHRQRPWRRSVAPRDLTEGCWLEESMRQEGEQHPAEHRSGQGQRSAGCACTEAACAPTVFHQQ